MSFPRLDGVSDGNRRDKMHTNNTEMNEARALGAAKADLRTRRRRRAKDKKKKVHCCPLPPLRARRATKKQPPLRAIPKKYNYREGKTRTRVLRVEREVVEGKDAGRLVMVRGGEPVDGRRCEGSEQG